MALTDWIGLEVHGSDDEKIGEVKDVKGDYLHIDRSMARDVVLPIRDCDMVGDHLVVPYSADYVDDQPEVNLDTDILSEADRRVLDGYYSRRAA